MTNSTPTADAPTVEEMILWLEALIACGVLNDCGEIPVTARGYIPAIRDALQSQTVRNDVLEEVAKLADEWDEGLGKNFNRFANAIRALKTAAQEPNE